MDAQEQLRTRFADHGLVRTSIAVNKVVAEHARPLAPAMLDAARAANVLLVTPPSWFGVHIARVRACVAWTCTCNRCLRPWPPGRRAAGPTSASRRCCSTWTSARSATPRQLRAELGLPPITPSGLAGGPGGQASTHPVRLQPPGPPASAALAGVRMRRAVSEIGRPEQLLHGEPIRLTRFRTAANRAGARQMNVHSHRLQIRTLAAFGSGQVLDLSGIWWRIGVAHQLSGHMQSE